MKVIVIFIWCDTAMVSSIPWITENWMTSSLMVLLYSVFHVIWMWSIMESSFMQVLFLVIAKVSFYMLTRERVVISHLDLNHIYYYCVCVCVCTFCRPEHVRLFICTYWPLNCLCSLFALGGFSLGNSPIFYYKVSINECTEGCWRVCNCQWMGMQR